MRKFVFIAVPHFRWTAFPSATTEWLVDCSACSSKDGDQGELKLALFKAAHGALPDPLDFRLEEESDGTYRVKPVERFVRLWLSHLREQSFVPRLMEGNLRWDCPKFVVRLWPTRGSCTRAHAVDASLLADYSAHLPQLSNVWHEYFDADKVGAFWTDRSLKERIMVVKLREEFSQACWDEEVLHLSSYALSMFATLGLGRIRHDFQVIFSRLEAARYCQVGPANKSYYGGDYRSWQRLTKEFPVKSRISFRNHKDDSCEIHFDVLEELEPNCYYALCLLHVQPVDRSSAKANEDLVIPFKTGFCGGARRAAVCLLRKLRAFFPRDLVSVIVKTHLWNSRFETIWKEANAAVKDE